MGRSYRYVLRLRLEYDGDFLKAGLLMGVALCMLILLRAVSENFTIRHV